MSQDKEIKLKISRKKDEPEISLDDKPEQDIEITGDQILENMLNTPPETHDEMKKKD